ncbi:hypothetical protein ABLN73_07475 [Mycobacterium tuberculosis]
MSARSRSTPRSSSRWYRSEAATKNAKAFHDKCENMTLSDFYC